MTMRLEVRESRPPIWASAAPALYLLACALCVRAYFLDRSADVGLAGMLVALGLAPAFAIPVVFASRKARLETDGDRLSVDGQAVKFDRLWIEPASRGTARIHVTLRSGSIRVFVADDVRAANLFAAKLPPVSAPAGALAA